MKAEDEGEIVLAVKLGRQLVGVGGDDAISLGWIAADQVALLLRHLAVEMHIGTFAPCLMLSITMPFPSIRKRDKHVEEEAEEEDKYICPFFSRLHVTFETNTFVLTFERAKY